MDSIITAKAGFILEPSAALIVPIVVGLVEVAKGLGLPARLAPAASLAAGFGLSALTGLTWQAALTQGIMIGLAASGLWSGARALAGR